MSVVTQIQIRRGTASQWTSANPTLAAGEWGFETDTQKGKIGDGSTAWNSLAYILGVGDIDGVTAGTGLSGGGSSGTVTVSIDTTVTADLTTAQTLTNKTISGSSNTLSNIANGSLTNSSITINGSPVSLGGSVTIEASSFVPSFMLGGMQSMARKFLVSIDLNKNELQNAVIQNLGTAPATPSAGQIYFNTGDGELYYYNGSGWVSVLNESEVISGTFAARPVAGVAGRLFFATDQQIMYFDNGTTWAQVSDFGSVTAQTTYGATSGNGSANTYSRSDHTHGTPSLTNATPQGLSVGGSGAVGTGTAPAREDHAHGMPSFGNVVTETSFGAASANGTSTSIARADHAHGTPTHDNAAHSAINLSALAVPLADINLNNNKITNVATPLNSTDAANKQYVDDVAQGLNIHAASYAATTANLTATYDNGTSGVGATLTNSGTQAAFSTDGLSPALNARILVKDQTNTFENGIYVLSTVGDGSTNWVLTRATDFDTAVEIAGGDFTFVDFGSTLANTGWVNIDDVTTVGTDPVVFQQFSGAGTYTASDGVLLTGNNFTGVVVASGGLTVGASGFALDTAIAVRKYAADVGDGAATSYTITHSLNTKDVIVSVYDNSSPYAEVVCDVQHTSTSAITLLFSVAPTSNQYRVVVHA